MSVLQHTTTTAEPALLRSVELESIPSNDSQKFQEAMLDQSRAYQRVLLENHRFPQSAGASLATADEDSPWAKKTVLCLDGGGIRGFSSLLILKELMRKIQETEETLEPQASSSTDSPLIEPGRAKAEMAKFPTQTRSNTDFLPCHYFDYIGGTSTGGLIAIMLGRLRMSVDDVLDEYIQLSRKVFGRSRHMRISGFVQHLGNKPKDSSLQSEISTLRPAQSSPEESEQVFKSDATRCRTIVCSMQSGTNKGFLMPCLYRSYPSHRSDGYSFNVVPGVATTLDTQDVIKATIATPSLFRSARSSASLNNPSFEIYKEVDLMHDQFSDPLYIFLSLGCGNFESKWPQLKRGHGVKKTSSSLSKFERHLSTVSDTVHKMMLEESKTHFSYYRLDVKDRLSTMRLNEWKPRGSGGDTVDRIKAATMLYLDDPEVRRTIQVCASGLVSKRRKRSETMRWETFALGTKYRCKFDGCDLEGEDGKSFVFRNRNDLSDHLQEYHNMAPPDSSNSESIKTLLDQGRTDSNSSKASSKDSN